LQKINEPQYINSQHCVSLERNYKKHYKNLDMEKGGGQEGKSDTRITESKARQRETLHCAQTKHIEIRKIPCNTENASRAARESTGTLAAYYGAREERRGRRRHPSQGKSGLHTICGGGQPVQDVIRVSDMDSEINLSAPRGQQLARMHPFNVMYEELCQKIRGVAAESIKFRDRKGNEADVGATPHPLTILLKLGLLNTA
jgi:hypothetical protein